MYFAENVSSYHKIEITKTEQNPITIYLIKGYINDDKNYILQLLWMALVIINLTTKLVYPKTFEYVQITKQT